MKWHKTLSVALVAAFALGAGACDDGLAELNENPNSPKDVPAQVLLPAALQATVEQAFGEWFNLEFAGLFTQHWAKIQYLEEDLYDLRPAVIDGFWSNFYAGNGVSRVPAGGLSDWQLIIEKGATEEPLRPNHEATGRVMKAYTGHLMTDIWGDMPWSEALQGAAEDPITTPVYDAQSAIYADLVDELDQALALFDADGVTFGPEDLIYGGDVAAWMRFANSLKLRMAIRMSDVDPTGAAALVTEVLNSSAGVIDENDENAVLAFLDAAPNQNPLYENWTAQGRDDHAVSSTLINMLGALDDPRIHVYAESPANDSLALGGDCLSGSPAQFCYVTVDGVVYRGMTNGTPEGDLPPINTFSRLGHHWRGEGNQGASTPAFLLTAAEVHFLLAEAVLDGLVPNALGMTAQELYEEGVTLSLQMWDGADGVEISAADINAYLAQPGVAWGTGDGNDELIAEQKWIALYTNGPEAYAELRRTGYPDEVQARTAHSFDFVPARVPYADVEQSLNAANWQAAMTAQGVTDDGYGGELWWDMTPQQ